MNELSIVVDKWFEIGIQLEIKPHILKAFEQQHSKDPRRCLSEMLQYWLDGKACEASRVNWETIIEALESPSIGEAAFANLLRQNILLQSETCEDDSESISTPGNYLHTQKMHYTTFP